MPAQAYEIQLIWEGNRGSGTAGYTGYERDYRVLVNGKPDLAGSADPLFRGSAERHNPEDLFVAAVASCHMLFYLALCARSGVPVVAYEDHAVGRLVHQAGGGGRFEEILLRPRVTIADGSKAELAERLHRAAQQGCFIANSCSVPIRHEVVVRTAEPAAGRVGCKT
jgi:organic hydroperoxide reductase OsmC/OhrA